MRAFNPVAAILAITVGVFCVFALPNSSWAAEYPFPSVNPRNTYPPATPAQPTPQTVPEPRMEKLLQNPSSVPYSQPKPPKRMESLAEHEQHPLENLLKNTLWASFGGALVGASIAGLNPDMEEKARYQESNLLRGAQIGATLGAVAGFAIGTLLGFENVRLRATEPLPSEAPRRNLPPNPRINPWGQNTGPAKVLQLAWNF